jgi:hypothetical protein
MSVHSATFWLLPPSLVQIHSPKEYWTKMPGAESGENDAEIL